MLKLKFIIILFFFGCGAAIAQVTESTATVRIQGTVLSEKDNIPISGVEVSSNRGALAHTNNLGEYVISVAIGDVLVFSSPEIETIRHRVRTEEDVDVVVKNYEAPQVVHKQASKNLSRASGDVVAMHQTYLDSAKFI